MIATIIETMENTQRKSTGSFWNGSSPTSDEPFFSHGSPKVIPALGRRWGSYSRRRRTSLRDSTRINTTKSDLRAMHQFNLVLKWKWERVGTPEIASNLHSSMFHRCFQKTSRRQETITSSATSPLYGLGIN